MFVMIPLMNGFAHFLVIVGPLDWLLAAIAGLVWHTGPILGGSGTFSELSDSETLAPP